MKADWHNAATSHPQPGKVVLVVTELGGRHTAYINSHKKWMLAFYAEPFRERITKWCELPDDWHKEAP